MKELNNNELESIRGGSISGTLINAFVRGIEALMDLGRSLGNAVRRIKSKAICRI
jgi:bacteriocin-like protein